MPNFPGSLRDWNTAAFPDTLRSELEGLKPGILPLLMGVSRGGVPDERDIKVMVLGCAETKDSIQARVGIFFSEILAGCSCGDEPMTLNAYCELQVSITKATAEAEFTVVPD
jgi:hypothetical protein